MAGPRSILFLCNRNAVRSPMAEALARRHLGSTVTVASVGLDADTLDPFSVAAMAEAGVDIAGHAPRALADLGAARFDLVVALTPQALAAAQAMGARAGAVEYWPTPDPAGDDGHRDAILARYRSVRDRLDARIRTRFPAGQSLPDVR